MKIILQTGKKNKLAVKADQTTITVNPAQHAAFNELLLNAIRLFPEQAQGIANSIRTLVRDQSLWTSEGKWCGLELEAKN